MFSSKPNAIMKSSTAGTVKEVISNMAEEAEGTSLLFGLIVRWRSMVDGSDKTLKHNELILGEGVDHLWNWSEESDRSI